MLSLLQTGRVPMNMLPIYDVSRSQSMSNCISSAHILRSSTYMYNITVFRASGKTLKKLLMWFGRIQHNSRVESLRFDTR